MSQRQHFKNLKICRFLKVLVHKNSYVVILPNSISKLDPADNIVALITFERP